MTQLDALKLCSTVVADTGDFLQLAQFRPQDATTNPSLILKSAQKPEYAQLVTQVKAAHPHAAMDEWIDRLVVRFAQEILQVVPGRVSMEVDARLAHDTQANIVRAQRMMAMAQAAGIDRERVLIKLAATWEGIQAAAALEREGIHCNLTLLFSFSQAVACADARVQLISPFVGRIYDWYKKTAGASWVEADNTHARDPGVLSVTRIYNHYKRWGVATEIMGASFRNLGQITALAGCDLLTISPDLLAQLQLSDAPLGPALNAQAAAKTDSAEQHHTEVSFAQAMADDVMATEKLAEGIRGFCADALRLEALITAA